MSKAWQVLGTSSVTAATMMFMGATYAAQPARPPAIDGLCTVAVNVPPPSGPPPNVGGAFPPNPQAERPRLVKVKDDVYVIENSEHVPSQIGQFGGNLTVYLTDEGVILIDAKNEQIHDHVVAQIRTLTDKPIKYVVLTHHHPDHSGAAGKFQQAGAAVVMSRDDGRIMAANGSLQPQVTFSRYGNISLGGKQVQLTEHCGHTRGDTVAYLPAARVAVAGDLVNTGADIPIIVNNADGGNWTDLIKAHDAIAALDFDFLVGGHGPVISKQDFLKLRDQMVRVTTRARALVKEGKNQQEVTQTLIKELNFGAGVTAIPIGSMMAEFK